MSILGIVELAHVFPQCVVEDYVLSIMAMVTVILKLFFICVVITIFTFLNFWMEYLVPGHDNYNNIDLLMNIITV